MKHDNSKPIGCNKSSSKREVYSNTILPQETRKPQNRQRNLHLKELGKEQQQQQQKKKKNKISGRKEIIKI